MCRMMQMHHDKRRIQAELMSLKERAQIIDASSVDPCGECADGVTIQISVSTVTLYTLDSQSEPLEVQPYVVHGAVESPIIFRARAAVWLRWQTGIVDGGGGSLQDTSEALNFRCEGIEDFAIVVGLHGEAKNACSDLVGDRENAGYEA